MTGDVDARNAIAGTAGTFSIVHCSSTPACVILIKKTTFVYVTNQGKTRIVDTVPVKISKVEIVCFETPQCASKAFWSGRARFQLADVLV